LNPVFSDGPTQRLTTSDVVNSVATDKQVLDLARTLGERELAPRVSDYESRGDFPREVFRALGRAGFLGLLYPESQGGSGRSLELYVQVLEILASHWLTVAQAVNVHVLACYPLAHHGTPEQIRRFMPDLLTGERLGANCLSEEGAGSDLSAISVRATRDGDDFVIDGRKAWSTHAGIADFYNVYCRTGGTGTHGISCFFVDAATPGVRPQELKRKMGLRCSPTAPVLFDGARVGADRLIGRQGRGFLIATEKFEWGRLGVAACAVGLAQAAVDYAARYARSREQFGQPIIGFQGVGFMLADMATSVAAARALVRAAAARRDRGDSYAVEGAKAKLFATETAMRVTTDAVQVLGGYGYIDEHPVERWMREAKMLQLVEGTSQMQRIVISRAL
jgi:alkylation response protein AidB-like acyl-CoA dehydrogenase